jgi:guanylate kinase
MKKNDKKKLFVISGSSGVGKGTIISSFLSKNPTFKLSISYTTRSLRTGERDGESYFFISKENFKRDIEKGEFLEWAEFSGNYYGTGKKFVEKCLDRGEDLILEIDTKGAMQVREKMPESVLIFIAPPSVTELEDRLRKRNTEPEAVIQKRLDCVKRELEASKKYDYIVVNDTVENAVSKIEKIIEENNA